MSSPRIAILGVSGQLGQALARELANNPAIDRFVGIDITPPPETHASMAFHQADIAQADLGALFAAEKITHVADLAFMVAPNHNRKRTHFVNVQGTANVLRAVASAGIQGFLFCSSVNVYGAHPDHSGPLPETTPTRPDLGIQYSLDKVQAEKQCTQFQSEHPETQVSIIRPVTIVGPTMDNFISRFLDRPVLIAPRGYDPGFQYVHEIDVARAILALLLGNHAGVFNLGGDNWTPLSEVLQRTGKRVLKVPRRLLKFTTWLAWHLRLRSLTEIPPPLIDYLCFPPIVDASKIKDELGFVFQYNSCEAIDTLLQRKALPAAQ